MGRSSSRNDCADNMKKSQLVIDICNVSLRASSCAHKQRSRFVDWYLVLGIDESAGVDVVKKRYRRLALQLHPDKNKHPNAEVAFKLVSEAYVCLADNVRRAAFDLQRQSSFCEECCRNPHLNFSQIPKQKPARVVKSSNVWQILKDLKARLFQEATVIENCMKINNAGGMKEPRTCCDARIRSREYPIFNPSDYVFHGYPHRRNQKGRVQSVSKKCQSPVFKHI